MGGCTDPLFGISSKRGVLALHLAFQVRVELWVAEKPSKAPSLEM